MNVRSSRLAASLFALALTAVPLVARADLTGARAACARGDSSAAEALVRALRPADRAAGERLLARIELETGRYDDARALGERIARAPATRAEGLTIQGEALVATGDYPNAV